MRSNLSGIRNGRVRGGGGSWFGATVECRAWVTAKELKTIIHAALRGQLDEASAHKLHALRPEAVSLATLAMSRHIAKPAGKGNDSPATIE